MAEAEPFSLGPHLRHRCSPLVTRWLTPALDGALALSRLGAVYRGLTSINGRGPSFWDDALDALDVTVEVSQEDLDSIPGTGPLVIVANHPFGGLDGLALLSIVHRVRPDVRVFGNHWLEQIPDAREALIAVDTVGPRGSVRPNASAARRGLRWVTAGHALLVFPAGTVSHREWDRRAVTDPPWHRAAARLAQMAGAPVVPVLFHGANSGLFQMAGLVHPRLRTMLLPREVLKRQGSAIKVSVGGSIPAAQVKRFKSADALTSYLRARTFVLRGRSSSAPAKRLALAPHPVAPAQPVSALRRDIAALPAAQCVIESAPYSVWLATRSAAPNIVNEIGRLRELTFRDVGEGTGRPSDLDVFDDHYQHLFVWNDGTGEVVGAYRIGRTDQIVPRLGAAGLYTHTLFQLRAGFLDQITPALELGRSFVRREYQREFAPLMLLWKGIGQFVANHPQYARLFGAVSISRDYARLSQQLLMTFLQATRHDEGLAAHVTPRNRPAMRPHITDLPGFPQDFDHHPDRMDDLVREVERGERGMPVLLRQYLKLEAKVVGFNVDPAFGDVLDALMLVDLRAVDQPVLVKYLGRTGAARFLGFHERREPIPSPRSTPPMMTPAPARA